MPLRPVGAVEPASRLDYQAGSALTVHTHDTLLLGSDGLFDNLQVEEIAQIIRKGALPSVMQALVSTCRNRMESAPAGEPSNPDDLTAVVYRFRVTTG